MTFYNYLKSKFEVNVCGGQIRIKDFPHYRKSLLFCNTNRIYNPYLNFQTPEVSSYMLIIQEQVFTSFPQLIKQVQERRKERK